MSIQLVHVTALWLAVGGVFLAVLTRWTRSWTPPGRPYQGPLLVVLASMGLLLTTYPPADSLLGPLLVGGAQMVALGSIFAIAVTDPNHTRLPPWHRGPV